MYKQLGWLVAVVDAKNAVGKFFTNVDKARALYDKFSPNLKLKRPAVTRFATSHDMLASLRRGRNALEKCVRDTAWVDKMVRADQLAAFREVTSIVLGRDGFWDKVDKALIVMTPVVELLLVVDGPGATMSKVYFKMDALVERMRGLDCVTPGEKADIEDILMHQWSFMTSELHCTPSFLDPEFRHSALSQRDREEEVHIPWEDDQPVEAEVEEWYNTWVVTAMSNNADAANTPDDAEVEEEDGDEPLMRIWLRNDERDDEECEAEDIALLVLFTEEERAQEQEARAAGTWVDGAGDASTSRKHGKKRVQREDVEEVVLMTKRSDADQGPKHKRGQPSNAELAKRKAQIVEAKAAKAAAAAAAARSATARKGRKKKARSNVIDDGKSGDDAAALVDNDAAAASDEAAAAPSSASSSSSLDDEDANGSGVESMEHNERDGDDTCESSEESEGRSGNGPQVRDARAPAARAWGIAHVQHINAPQV
ncbi:hypothetical protein CBR_g36365 [Chara braunii]|uniref:Uncharacterized protein n=1 Tax=Chara braunii TaxID=69332 RepID=A0A388LKT0_CHABU|nr:hypothetical protein CBR_g36365 [Chara braunii]|eukprot:GBG82835.1 hypothetical protein CBR_g36365 [Chara braunii]